MKKIPLSLLALLSLTASGFALTPTEWQRRQTVNVGASGLTKVALPAATFDSALSTLADLRLLDPSGMEVPFLLDRDPAPRQPSSGRALASKSFRSTPNGDTTQLVIETGTSEPLDAIDLETPAPFFLKAAHVEISGDGVTWESLGPALPVFRQFGAEQLQLPLNRRNAPFIRVTLDDFRSRQVDFSGAKVLPAPTHAAPPVLAPLGARITRRDEFAGETVLTVTLDGSHVLLAGLTLDAKDPLFMRRVEVTVREARGATSGEVPIGSGTIYRLALDSAPARSQLNIPLEFSPATKELLVHICNGDSPPLKIDGLQAEQHPVNLLFNAAAAGTYTILSGNPQADAPRYDLAAFAGEMRAARAAPVVPGNVEETPDYRPRESLATPPMPDVPLTGAPLDPTPWSGRQQVQISQPGVQELELDVEALARALPDGSDLRVLRDGNQIPYVLERPALARSLALTPANAPNIKRPNTSVWKLQLPQAGLPIQRITLSTTTPLFQRKFRLYEKVTGPEGQEIEIPLASGDWSRTPGSGVPDTRTFPLSDRLRGDTLWIETENGDNPPINLGTCQAVYPVVRLVFKVAETDGFVLAYGNKAANTPRYDLNLVAVKLLTSSRNVAQLATGGQNSTSPLGVSNSINGGYVFWAALAVVVVALLVVVAKLLPKPPGQ
jgi:hypothetical protein